MRTPWNSLEAVSPIQAVVHKVMSQAQWQRVERLVKSWTPAGKQAPPCFDSPWAIKDREGAAVHETPAPKVWPGVEPSQEPRVRQLLPFYFQHDTS